MDGFKISVVVPVYNTAKHLKRCVDSLINQSCRNVEILLIDDGSRDESGRLCDEYAQQDMRIRVVHKENGGLISAWKRGAEESTGEYLCFVDSDDWIDLNMLEEMAQRLSGNEKEIIASDYIIEREKGQEYVWQALPPGEYLSGELKQKVVPRLLGYEHRYITISRCMKLISRRLITDNCKYSDPVIRLGEDTTIMLPALIDCERLVIMDHKAYYHYYYETESMVHKYDSGLYENIRRLRRIMDRILADKFEGEELAHMKCQADKEYLLLMLLVLKNEARGNREGYRKNILSVCRQPEIRELCRKVPLEISQKSNKLLYFTLRHPNEVTVRLLRLAMILYYRKEKACSH